MTTWPSWPARAETAAHPALPVQRPPASRSQTKVRQRHPRPPARPALRAPPWPPADSDPAPPDRLCRQPWLPLIAKPARTASRGVSLMILDQFGFAPPAGRPDYILQAYLGDPDAVPRPCGPGLRWHPLFHSFGWTNYSIGRLRTPTAAGPACSPLAAMRQGAAADASKRPASSNSASAAPRAFAAEGWRGPTQHPVPAPRHRRLRHLWVQRPLPARHQRHARVRWVQQSGHGYSAAGISWTPRAVIGPYAM